MRAREGTLRNLRTLYASRFCARRVLDSFFHIEKSCLSVEIEYAKGEESTATGLNRSTQRSHLFRSFPYTGNAFASSLGVT